MIGYYFRVLVTIPWIFIFGLYLLVIPMFTTNREHIKNTGNTLRQIIEKIWDDYR